MSQRLIPVVLLLILVVLHGQLWFGPRSIPSVSVLQHRLDEQKAANARAQQAIDQLQSEVADLKSGLATVEEKARMDLGMVKQGEIFVQVTPRQAAQ